MFAGAMAWTCIFLILTNKTLYIMLYPFTITFDLHIQADNYESAKKIAAEIVDNVGIDSEHSSICDDCIEVSDYAVLDIND